MKEIIQHKRNLEAHFQCDVLHLGDLNYFIKSTEQIASICHRLMPYSDYTDVGSTHFNYISTSQEWMELLMQSEWFKDVSAHPFLINVDGIIVNTNNLM